MVILVLIFGIIGLGYWPGQLYQGEIELKQDEEDKEQELSIFTQDGDEKERERFIGRIDETSEIKDDDITQKSEDKTPEKEKQLKKDVLEQETEETEETEEEVIEIAEAQN